MPKPPAGRRPAAARDPKLTIGWREWIALPDLGVEWIKVKVDTGARTSSLHVFDLERFRRRGAPWARFTLHPLQRKARPEIHCEALIVDERKVRSSSGHVSERPVIETWVALGERTWPIEITLTSRDEMGFRMLLGRQAVRTRCVIDPGRSFLTGRRPRRPKRKKRTKRKTKRTKGTS